jgi:hypothetical protein
MNIAYLNGVGSGLSLMVMRQGDPTDEPVDDTYYPAGDTDASAAWSSLLDLGVASKIRKLSRQFTTNPGGLGLETTGMSSNPTKTYYVKVYAFDKHLGKIDYRTTSGSFNPRSLSLK